MAKFMIAYYGEDQPRSKEEGMAQRRKWNDWIEGLGDSVIDPGTPLIRTIIVTADNFRDEEDPNGMKGFAIVKAESIEAAIEIAESDPFLEMGGTIRLSQIMEMS